ncbi:hypothetical protein AN8964.2 [Aspergillus nidulans FGSC A4]|uniref:FAD-binding PCMH-type domain-containing protein n=1 Tax=Emericella nidulans (strain FGSC A4 / ATCC 38163 / CBS 112.46 / NRRL 194 / M139) TaxID=227321 RepID=Q5ARW6_EMENI|nr:hypothetical protein [Aspergillus nidulans FGSC A4]EAA63759.1 hypothetical protein AN8964.2 [Aspergillus nidulans FGSC A4]CBF84557.1 TPA: conserved hypothetical protein [Aspergillus nidulans FGSC A4]|eukprot:XP_682233.1 hypothetical protein AN8964.2 [Aspergillus nidulans FGSC A4]
MDTREKALANLHAAGLSDILYLPSSDVYSARVESYWSLTAQLKPWAIVRPRNTEEVSKAVKAIVATPDVKFAIRSGGHMQWPGANNIVNGITIDLGLMNSTTYDPETGIASIQPGGTWAKSYQELEKQGRMVAGGREGKVGIGGLLTGGGKTFYTCRNGFACDQVVNYELVLADGSISNANSTTNPDLFRALKGGGNNFGVVTRFDMTTFSAVDVWDCTITYPKKATLQLSEAIVDLTKNLAAYPDDHILAMWTYLPKTEEHFVMVNMMNLEGVKEARTLEKFLGIPEQMNRVDTTVSVATKLTSFVVPSGKYDTWYTTTFKADPQIILKSASVFESLVSALKNQVPYSNFYTQIVLQPLPVSFGAHSTARGGNMMGLDQMKVDCVLLVWAVEVDTPELNANVAGPTLKSAIEKIETYARSVKGDVGFRYLNYCDKEQDALGSYGEENVRHMKEVAVFSEKVAEDVVRLS